MSGGLEREIKVASESTEDIKHPLQAGKSSLVLLQSRTGPQVLIQRVMSVSSVVSENALSFQLSERSLLGKDCHNLLV